MRRLMVVLLMAGTAVAGAALRLPAHADTLCQGQGSDPAYVNPAYSDGTHSGVEVCAGNDTADESVRFTGNSDFTGYFVVDGVNPGQPEPTDGYYGLDSDKGLVACSSGDYSYGSGQPATGLTGYDCGVQTGWPG